MEPTEATDVGGGRCRRTGLGRHEVGREKPSWGQVDTRQQGKLGWLRTMKKGKPRQRADMTASVAKHVRKTSDPTVQRRSAASFVPSNEVAMSLLERFSELLKQLVDQENQDR